MKVAVAQTQTAAASGEGCDRRTKAESRPFELPRDFIDFAYEAGNGVTQPEGDADDIGYGDAWARPLSTVLMKRTDRPEARLNCAPDIFRSTRSRRTTIPKARGTVDCGSFWLALRNVA